MRLPLILTGVILVAGNAAAPKPDLIVPFELPHHDWQEVHADTAYVVSLDIANVAPGPESNSFAVWYQTRHLALKKHEGQDWNREVIRSLLRCDPLSFKTVLMTIFLADGPPVAQIGKSSEEAEKEAWRPVTPGSVDEASLRGACKLLQAGN